MGQLVTLTFCPAHAMLPAGLQSIEETPDDHFAAAWDASCEVGGHVLASLPTCVLAGLLTEPVWLTEGLQRWHDQ